MRSPDVAVVMPAYNEADGIAEFLCELELALAGHEVRFVVVDDASTDTTTEVLERLAAEGFPVEVIRSSINRGHGPTTLHALRVGLRHARRVVVAVDGDGQFEGSDIACVVARLLDEDRDVVEGVRTARDDPWFRRVTAAATRGLVRLRCGRSPRDANTPLRAYRPQALERLLAAVPADAVTPNLVISALSRAWALQITEYAVAHRRHRGDTVAGSTWQARRRNVPSTRFLAFCVAAVRQWIGLREAMAAAGDAGHNVRRSRWSALALMLPALLLAGCYGMLGYWVPIRTDSGVFMYCGRTLLDGLAPYADCWDHKGPALYLFNAAGLALGGPRGVILFEGVLLTASLAFATWCWAKVTSTRVAVLVGTVYAVTFLNLFEGGNLTETWLSAFSLVAYALFLRVGRAGPSRRQVSWAALAIGVAIGVALTTRPNNGLGLGVVALALVLASRHDMLRRAATVFVGAVLVCLPVLTLVASRDALAPMWAQYVDFNRTYASAPAAVRAGALAGFAVLLLLMPLVLLVLRYHADPRHDRGTGVSRSASYALAAAAVLDFLSQGLSGRGNFHYLVTVLPALATYGIAVAAARGGHSRADRAPLRRIAALGFSSLVVVSLGAWSVWIGLALEGAAATGLTNRTSPMRSISDTINAATAPDDTVLVYGAQTGLLAAADRRSPAALTYLLPQVETGPLMREYVDQVTAHPPRLIVRVPDQPPFTETRCRTSRCDDGQRSLDRLSRWILTHYRLRTTTHDFEVWELDPNA